LFQWNEFAFSLFPLSFLGNVVWLSVWGAVSWPDEWCVRPIDVGYEVGEIYELQYVPSYKYGSHDKEELIEHFLLKSCPQYNIVFFVEKLPYTRIETSLNPPIASIDK